jgi:hypothetical protein
MIATSATGMAHEIPPAIAATAAMMAKKTPGSRTFGTASVTLLR